MTEKEDLLPAVQGSAAFRTTHWSVVLQAGKGEEHQATKALEQLCRAYWYPLYAYVRRRGHPPEAAKDLVQGFIESLLARHDLNNVTPGKGRFRTFLLTAMSHFLANDWRQARTQKRGGGRPAVALDGLPAEERYRFEPATEETPEAAYERKWAWEVMNGARARLRAEYAGAGKEDLFALLEPFLTGGHDAELRAGIAVRFGISVGAVDVALHRLRRRYGEIVRQLIAETVSGPQAIDEEIKHLMNVLAR